MTVEYAPAFLQGANEARIRVKRSPGSSYTLNCESDENPKGNVSWVFVPRSKDKTELSHTDKILKISNINSSVEGFYECTVRNSLGTSKKFFEIILYPLGENFV